MVTPLDTSYLKNKYITNYSYFSQLRMGFFEKVSIKQKANFFCRLIELVSNWLYWSIFKISQELVPQFSMNFSVRMLKIICFFAMEELEHFDLKLSITTMLIPSMRFFLIVTLLPRSWFVRTPSDEAATAVVSCWNYSFEIYCKSNSVCISKYSISYCRNSL